MEREGDRGAKRRKHTNIEKDRQTKNKGETDSMTYNSTQRRNTGREGERERERRDNRGVKWLMLKAPSLIPRTYIFSVL